MDEEMEIAEPLYETDLIRSSIFKGFWTRFLDHPLFPDYKTEYPPFSYFITIYAVSAGKVIYHTKQYQPDETLITPLCALEGFIGHVPDEMFLPNHLAQQAIATYLSVLLTPSGAKVLPGLCEYLELIYSDTSPHFTELRSTLSSVSFQSSPHCHSKSTFFTDLDLHDELALRQRTLPFVFVFTIIISFARYCNETRSPVIMIRPNSSMANMFVACCTRGNTNPELLSLVARELIESRYLVPLELHAQVVAAVWREVSVYITPSNAECFFNQLYTILPDDCILLKRLVDQARWSGMMILNIIRRAQLNFPDFPWLLVEQSLPHEFNAYCCALKMVWNKPFIGFGTNLPEELSPKNYETIGYLAQQLLLRFGSTHNDEQDDDDDDDEDDDEDRYEGSAFDPARMVQDFSGVKWQVRREVDSLLQVYENKCRKKIDPSPWIPFEQGKLVTFSDRLYDSFVYACAAQISEDVLGLSDDEQEPSPEEILEDAKIEADEIEEKFFKSIYLGYQSRVSSHI